METLEELKEEFDKLNKKRGILFKKILELEDLETLKKFTVGNCYRDIYNNHFAKVIAIDNDELCAIIIDDNRVCRVVLPSFSMNGGDVYGTILFSRLNVFWNVHDSIAYVHYFEHKKVILHIEKPPLNFAG